MFVMQTIPPFDFRVLYKKEKKKKKMKRRRREKEKVPEELLKNFLIPQSKHGEI